jgi:protein-S-isoprenylcysteine O-methyltransferase Ste14
MKNRIRLQGIAVFLASLCALLLLKFVFPHWRNACLDEIFDLVGITLVLFGFLFRIAARGYKEEQSSQGRALVKDGPYALTRNPMYFGSFLIGIGVSLVILMPFFIIPFILVFLLIYLPQIKKEKELLSQCFGSEYAQYSQETPAFFPQLGALIKFKDYSALKIYWIKKELPQLLLTIAGLILIELWEDVKFFGRSDFFKEIAEAGIIIMIFILLVSLSSRHQGKRLIS